MSHVPFYFQLCVENVVACNESLSFLCFSRYINHSCAPNCVAEVVTFERGYKIIISCNRRVEKGEEVNIFIFIRIYYTIPTEFFGIMDRYGSDFINAATINIV